VDVLVSLLVASLYDFKTEKNLPNKEQLKQIEKLEIEGGEEEDNFNYENPEGEDADNNYYYEGEEGEDYAHNHQNENEWFFCDECKKIIKENKIKYECDNCPDFMLCKECFKSVKHPHKMKKSKVPLGCKPPVNWQEILENMKNEEKENNLSCSRCTNEITNNYYFICNNEECSDLKFCKTCRGIGKSIHDHKLTKFTIEEQNEEVIEEEEKNPKKKLETMIENAFSEVPDEIIAKEIPTKFHYTKVEKDDLGLTDEMLLYLDDKTLNKYIPLRRLAPYREKVKLNEWEKKKMLKHLSKEVERRKAEVSRANKMAEENILKNKKLLNNKRKGVSKVQGEGEDYRKKKRLETYGIDV